MGQTNFAAKTNCLTEILFAEARAQAKALDTHLATTSRVVGPLHGLPISLKDCFITPPHPSSIGIAAFANGATTADQESTLPALLRSLGAVAYVKTKYVHWPEPISGENPLNHLQCPGCHDDEGDRQQCLGSDLQSVPSRSQPWWLIRWGSCTDCPSRIPTRCRYRHWRKCSHTIRVHQPLRIATFIWQISCFRHPLWYPRSRVHHVRQWSNGPHIGKP